MTEDRTYSDFDLLIEGDADEGYRARVVDSPAGQAAGAFELPFSEIQLENFMLKVGRPRRGVRRLESPEMEAAREFGTQLFDAVFQDDLKLSLRRSLDEVERRDEGLRIRLWFSDAPELASLPWEFLFSETDDQFLVLSAWTPIVRYLDLTRAIEPLTVTGPLRILAMISSPHDYPELDVEEEWARIESALEPLVERGAVVIDRIDNATLLEVQRLLRKHEYHIFHFVGHGGFDEKANDGVLVLEDGNNRSRLVAGRDLGTILNDHRSLRLAVLNACEGGRAGDEDPFSGAAQSLVRKGIPGVVAMQFEITDDAAIAFAQEFYGAIADGYPVDAAIGESRRAIFAQGNDIEWGTPVVYLRGDGRLFDVQPGEVEPEAVAVAAATEVLEPEPDAALPTEADEPVVEPVEAESEPDLEDAAVVASAAVAGKAVDEELKLAESIVQTVEEDEESPPEDSPSSFKTALLAIPMWVLWALIGAGALLVVVLAVNVFGGTETTTTADAGVATTTVPVEEEGETTPTTAPIFLAEDGDAIAYRTSEPKTIDGRADDWPELGIHVIDHLIFSNGAIRDGDIDRAGATNNSEIRLAWDTTNLYVFADVEDDVHSARSTGADIFRDDSINLHIVVLDAGGRSEAPDENDHGLTLSPGERDGGTREESAHYIVAGQTLGLDYAEVAAEHRDDGYTLEARIPWAEIGVFAPQPGDVFGLLLSVNDNDGERLEKFLQAEITGNMPGDGDLDNSFFRSPKLWGTLTLKEAP